MSYGEIIHSSKEIEGLLNNSNLSFENLRYLAREVSENTWSPFSQFPVGAVVVGIDQSKKLKVFSGTNVEPNVHSAVCAERVAIFNGIAAGYKKFLAIAISLPKADKNITGDIDLGKFMPCGACREVILQKLDHKGLILIDDIERTFTPKELLPRPLLDQTKLRTLTIEEMDTLEQARTALNNAHVPHSREKYGVAILVDGTKEIFSACTLDSTSFGCSVEPLRAAFGAYTAKGGIKNQNKIKAIAFAFPFIKYPPGDTLQLISDYCDPKTRIIIDNMGVSTIEEMMPYPFKL
jgi:cytidine deaminase